VSGDDGMDSSTQVPAIRRVWVPVAMFCYARYLMSSLPEVLALVVHVGTENPLGEVVGNP
jgi:hypothetical protein